MKYLGVTLDCKLDWYPHPQYLENKVLRIRNNLVRCSTATWGMTFHNLMKIYKYFIRFEVGVLLFRLHCIDTWYKNTVIVSNNVWV